jgi:hypothetical protein
MGSVASPNVSYFLELPRPNPHHLVPVKTEASSSPDLSPDSTSLQHFQFKFNPHAVPSHASVPQSRNPSESPSCLPPTPLYRFGSDPGPYSEQPWPRSTNSHHLSSTHNLPYNNQPNLNGHNTQNSELFRPTMSYSDDYDVSDLADGGGDQSHGAFGGSAHEKIVRRRSSKGKKFSVRYRWVLTVYDSSACDQCRKSKCKCERTSPNEPCKSCIMLGTRECLTLLDFAHGVHRNVIAPRLLWLAKY